MSQEPKDIDYLMNVRLLPLLGDDVNDFYGDSNYIRNCSSKSELQRMIRFLTESKPDLIAAANSRLSLLEGRSTPPPTTTKIEECHQLTPISQTELNRRKEEFLNFTKILLRYLEHKNRGMYSEAKTIIGECVDRNKKREKGYESVTIAMKRRLKVLVGEHYWERAKVHFYEHLRRNKPSNSSPVKKSQRAFARQASGDKGVACV